MQNQRFILNPYKTQFNKIDCEKQAIILFYEQIDYFLRNIKVPQLHKLASKQHKNQINYDMYQGSGSYALLYYKLYMYQLNHRFFKEMSNQTKLNHLSILKNKKFNQLFQSRLYFERLNTQLENLLLLCKSQNNKKKQTPYISYYFSPLSINLLSIMVHKNNKKRIKQHIDQILSYHLLILQKMNIMVYQLLYGLPGYVYILLKIEKEFKGQYNLQTLIGQLAIIILNYGIKEFQKSKHKMQRLMFKFYGTEYYGGAHGLAGTLFILIQCLKYAKFKQNQKINLIQWINKSIEFLINIQSKNGGWIVGTGIDQTLCQFCHGAPGIIPTLCNYLLTFKSQQVKGLHIRVLQSILKGQQHVWNQGILKKGYGLCHGISGNAYSFLFVIQLKNIYPQKIDQKKLRKRAKLFWTIKNNQIIWKQIKNYKFKDRNMKGQPDHPYSLMQGNAGDIIFFIDMLNESVQFPGLTI